MTPEIDPKTLRDAEAFDLLLRPEAWPDDPVQQARLAQMLEIHLALGAHPEALQELAEAPAPRTLLRRFPWLMSAAALLLVALPLVYHAQRAKYLAEVARNQARIQDLAQKRAQDRLWAAFFRQSSALIQDFSRRPPLCENRETEDRTAEREVAYALLERSHKLAAQGAPGPEAEAVRSDLHAWLMELSLEDGCMDPQRAQELRQWASTHKLEDEAERLSRILKGEAS
jgi:Fe-S-cluster formation regulator IscX/YfhJ/heme exporter protein D